MSRNYDILRKAGQEIEESLHRNIQLPPLSETTGLPGRLNEAPITTYIFMVWQRRWTVMGFALLITLIVGIISFATKPTYEGVAEIAIYRENQGLLSVRQDAHDSSEDSDYTVTLDTQAKIIEGGEIANQVIQKLGLDRNPDFNRNGHRRVNDGRNAIMERFHDSLTVVKVPHTRLLQIRFLSPNPRLAAEVANALAKAYIDHTFKVRYDSTMQASKRLADELADLQKATDDAEARLVAYQRTHGMVGAEQLTGTRLADLNKDLTDVEVERTRKKAEYNLVGSGGPDEVKGVEPNSLLERLRARESEVSTEYAKLTTVMGDANPQVKALKNELDNVRGSIAAELDRMRHRVSNEYRALTARENWLRSALENQKREAARQNEETIEYNDIKGEADNNRRLYADLLHKLKEAEVAAKFGADNVRIEALATVPTKPSKPNTPFNLAMALFGGVIGGVVLAFIRDTFDGSVRNAQQAESISGAPTWAMIPKAIELTGTVSNSKGLPSRGQYSRAAAIVKPDSPVIESYRALRSLVLLHFSETSPRALLVTSPLSGDGKTTTAINAAMAFAQNGRRVLLIDADFRNPSVHQAWGHTAPTEGLSTLFGNASRFEKLLLRCPGRDNLFILPAGPAPRDPAALLGGERMRQLIFNLRQQFAYVFIDAPPVLGPSDALVLAAEVDAVLLVVRESSTPQQALARSCALLQKAKARTVAIIVNAVEKRHLSDYYYSEPRSNSERPDPQIVSFPF